MNEEDLSRMLKHASSTVPAATPVSLESAIMARVRSDDGREKRWRSFVRWLLALAVAAGIVTAAAIGWSVASRDTTHSRPPAMQLFHEGLTK